MCIYFEYTSGGRGAIRPNPLSDALAPPGQNNMSHGWTRMHTDKNERFPIRVNPCPSVAKSVFRKLIRRQVLLRFLPDVGEELAGIGRAADVQAVGAIFDKA
jgi:hypothetical protein